MTQPSLAVYAPHVVQYHSPIYRELAAIKEMDTRVLFADRLGLDATYQPEFQRDIQWDQKLIEGFEHQFFKNFARKKMGGFLSRFNPSMALHVMSTHYDALLIQGYQTATPWLLLIAAKISRTRVIFRGEAIPRPERKNWKGQISGRIARLFLRFCDHVMYSCTGNKDFFLELGVPPEKLKFLPCAVDNTFFQVEESRLRPHREKIRQDAGINPEQKVILFSARFTERKRPLDVITAVAAMRDSSLVLLFVGDGPLREKMMHYAKQLGVDCIFTGFLGQAELPEKYILADLFVIVSEYDASPKALNEALNFGLPIICSDRVGTSTDLVKEGLNGFIVPAKSPEEITRAIRKVFSMLENSQSIERYSKDIVEAWTVDRDAQSIFQLVKSYGGEHA